MKRRDLEVTVPRGRHHWYADYYDRYGRRHRFSLGVPADRPVREALRELELRRREETEKQLTSVKVDKAFDEVYAHVGQTRDPQTAERYRQNCAHFLRFLESRRVRYLSDLRPNHIAKFAAWYLAEGHAPGGVNSALRTLRATLNLLAYWGQMPEDYSGRTWFSRVFLSEDKKRDRIFSEPELRVLFADDRYGDIYEALYLLGCRAGVLLRLHTSHISDELILLPRGKQGQLHDVPITSQFRNFLSCHQPSSEKGYLFWRDSWGDPDNPRDHRSALTAINRRLKRVLHKAGYKPARVHDLRATCATHLSAAGMPMQALMQYIGWTQPSTALKYYRPCRLSP